MKSAGTHYEMNKFLYFTEQKGQDFGSSRRHIYNDSAGMGSILHMSVDSVYLSLTLTKTMAVTSSYRILKQ